MTSQSTAGGSAANLLWTTTGTGTFADNTMTSTTYTPSAADVSAVTVDLTVTADAEGLCPQVSDALVLSMGQPVQAANATLDVHVQQTATLDVIGISAINAGDMITVTLVKDPVKGVATTTSSNLIDYVANLGTVGTDSYQYRICNQCGECSDGEVTINILNEPPVITQPPAQINGLAGQTVAIPLLPLISDLNDNLDPSSLEVISGPASGALVSFDANFNVTLDYSGTAFAGTDMLTIQVCDLLGACSTIDLTIEINGEITVYTAISPNGDNKNDFLLIENITFLAPQNKVSIFNRWGSRIFEINDYDNNANRFEGKSSSGSELPNGIYFYKIEFVDGRKKLTGYLELKR